MVRVAVVGATGFAGEKLIEILLRHPKAEIVTLACRVEKPRPVGEVYPRFKGLLDVSLEPIDPEKICSEADVVFLALPHTVSCTYVQVFLQAGKIVIDLSADYRLKDAEVYQRYYGVEHPDKKNISQAVYGMPELYRDAIQKAKFVANPGCYPTVSILSVAPLIAAGHITNIIIDAKSGITGAGRKAHVDVLFTSINENMYAYKLFSHQHTPEITQVLGCIAGKPVEVVFSPHVVPLEQGILATVYGDIPSQLSREAVYSLYQNFFKNEPFVRVYEKGLPKVKNVVNSNFCDIGFEIANGKIIIVAVIDNLMKGASSQAVHNMNLMCGFPETTGIR